MAENTNAIVRLFGGANMSDGQLKRELLIGAVAAFTVAIIVMGLYAMFGEW